MRAFLVAAAAGCLAATLPSQIPAHAVLLNPSGAPLEPRLLRAGDTIHAVGYSAHTFGFNFIHYARSTDGGRTWPLREVPIGYAPLLCGVAVQGDLVVVLVYTQWLGPHTICSTDGGTTWAPAVPVSQQFTSVAPIQLPGTPGLHVAGATINVVWYEPRAAGSVWTNRSVDGGLTWQPTDTQLDAGVVAAASRRTTMQLVFGDATAVHVVWGHETAAGWVTFHQRSFDGGATWRAAPQFVGNGSPLRAAGRAATVYVVDANTPVTLRSSDGGDNWAPLPLAFKPVGLVAEGARVLAVGSAGLFPSPVTILLDFSVDDGVTWLPQPYTIVQARDFVAEPHLAGDAAFVRFWFPANSPNLAVPGAVIQSDDAGAQWRLLDDRVWHGAWPSAEGCLATTQTGYLGTNVYAYVLEGHTSFGQGTAGTGGIVPRLQGAGLPGLGRTFALDVSGARGGSAGAWFATFDASANVSLGAATLYLQQPIGPFWFLTSGTPGAAGGGTASLPIAVPMQPALRGLRLLSQAFVLDPAAIDGFTATRAVETWIR